MAAMVLGKDSRVRMLPVRAARRDHARLGRRDACCGCGDGEEGQVAVGRDARCTWARGDACRCACPCVYGVSLEGSPCYGGGATPAGAHARACVCWCGGVIPRRFLLSRGGGRPIARAGAVRVYVCSTCVCTSRKCSCLKGHTSSR